MAIEDVQHTVELNSDTSTGCQHCSQWIEGRVSAGINHYIAEHGYRLLHVGAQTTPGHDDGKAWHVTVAILGHDNPPPQNPPAKVVIGMSGVP